MKVIPLSSVPEKFYTIQLQNGKIAKLYQVILTRVKDVNPNDDITVYKYKVPCPVCNEESSAFSYDGRFFSDIQLNCKCCGVYFRPVVKRN